MFIIKLLSQHVSGIIMPIIRRTRVCTAAYGVLHCNKKFDNKHQNSCILLVSLSSPYVHDARSQEPKKEPKKRWILADGYLDWKCIEMA